MNRRLSDIHIDLIKEWDGEDSIVIDPDGSGGYQSFSNREEQRYNSTEFWCAMKKLDDLKVPRVDESNGQTYSIVGRIMWLSNNR